MSSAIPTKVHQVQLSEYIPVSAQQKEDRGGWVNYGDRNDFPSYLIELAESSPVHGALTTSISQMIAGKAFSGIDQATIDALKLDEVRVNTAEDEKLFGGFYIEVIWDLKHTKVMEVNSLPFENCRLSIATEDDEVNGVWYSNDWSNTRKKRNKPEYIPLFDKEAREEGRQCYYYFTNTRGSMYYGKPDYWPSVNWIELTKQIGIYHVNNIMNGLFPSFIINFFNGDADPETKSDLLKDWERKLSGARNAGKFLMTFNEAGVAKPEITTFPISDADKQYEFLSEESTKQIMIAHRVTSPLLFGIRDSGGLGSNADELRQSYDIFTSQVIKPYQQNICEALETILSVQNVEIVPFAPFADSTDATDSTGPAIDQPAAATALNGAQIASMIEILIQAASGIIPIESAKAVMKASFPTLTPQQIDDIFSGVTSGSITPAESAAVGLSKLMTHLQKKKPDLSDDKAHELLHHLDTVGEYIDDEEWELVDEAMCFETDEEEREVQNNIIAVTLANEGSYANGEDRSKWGDSGLYKLRYAYSQNLSEDSRQFCKRMVALSVSGKVFRYEDIIAMGDDGINGQFAPEGESNYNIFLWKGGVYCHHFWKRQIYFRKRKDGKFMPNDGLKNDIRVANVPYVPQKGAEGTAPIDTPSRGSLKY